MCVYIRVYTYVDAHTYTCTWRLEANFGYCSSGAVDLGFETFLTGCSLE